MPTHYDAVIILAGGINATSMTRVHLALKYETLTKYFIVSTRYTCYKPPLLTDTGFPLEEWQPLVKYLLNQGIEAERILIDKTSMDTLGNLYYTRLMLTEPFKLHTLLIITSDFAMPRVKCISERIFSDSCYSLDYCASDSILPDDVLHQRQLKERSAIDKFINLGLTHWSQFHDYINFKHTLYSSKRDVVIDDVDTVTLNSY